ncbi:MAG: 7-cyano-7-deazaguanine synthase QueC [Fidelibacterota bacterium]|nr:MAG: 7-cyano-7-deazaguanine synthase QueC [Candidatus Neomarinimicrobiota bacterium]
MARPIAVVLLSGGMDSCVTAAIAAQDYVLALLHANYGQRTEQRELQAFHDIADHYSVPTELRLVLNQHHLAEIGGSALTDPSIAVLATDPVSTGIPATYVPFRNANLLAAAASWAEVLEAGAIFAGAVEEDSSGYPDCRRTFYDAFEAAIEAGTLPETHIRVITPVIGLRKAVIIQLGTELRAPLHLTWSCYLNQDLPCGRCDSCTHRAKGFKEVGIKDPLANRSN